MKIKLSRTTKDFTVGEIWSVKNSGRWYILRKLLKNDKITYFCVRISDGCVDFWEEHPTFKCDLSRTILGYEKDVDQTIPDDLKTLLGDPHLAVSKVFEEGLKKEVTAMDDFACFDNLIEDLEKYFSFTPVYPPYSSFEEKVKNAWNEFYVSEKELTGNLMKLAKLINIIKEDI